MHITIVGGGFGGIKAALELSKNKNFNITIISDRDYFQYYPALYSTATGHSHLESWVPLGEIFADEENIEVVIDKIGSIDSKSKTISGESGRVYKYQKVIFALGSVTTYFGIPGLENYSYGIKSAAEIQQLKHRIYCDIAENKTIDKNYVIVGGGPTGVELAGALGTYIRKLCKRYGVRRTAVRVRLIEASPRLLPRSHPSVSKNVKTRLKQLGVRVQTGKKVEKATAEQLFVSGAPIESHTVIWTSGVANNPFYAKFPEVFNLAPNGKVLVNEFMEVSQNIYVIGDSASTKYSGLAQTALHDAIFVAKNIVRERSHSPLDVYKAVLPISIIPVGKNWAAFEWKFIRFYGRAASMMRSVADFVGYSDILPLGQALGTWRASMIEEDDYFAPSSFDMTKRR